MLRPPRHEISRLEAIFAFALTNAVLLLVVLRWKTIGSRLAPVPGV